MKNVEALKDLRERSVVVVNGINYPIGVHGVELAQSFAYELRRRARDIYNIS